MRTGRTTRASRGLVGSSGFPSNFPGRSENKLVCSTTHLSRPRYLILPLEPLGRGIYSQTRRPEPRTALPGFRLSLESFMLVATSTTADESDCRTVIPSRARDLGRRGEAPPQMLRRCGWLCMTLSEQRRWFSLLEALNHKVARTHVISQCLKYSGSTKDHGRPRRV